MVAHLPPSIKHLLTFRKPGALPSPPLSQLNRLFDKTFREAQSRKAETGWLALTTCTLLTVNRPSAVGHLYRFVTRNSLEDASKSILDVPSAVNKAALMRESALKSVIFVGVPRVILSLAALHSALDEEVKAALRTDSRRTASPDNVQSIVTQGRALWDSIYAPHADKLHDKLGSYHPDFIGTFSKDAPDSRGHAAKTRRVNRQNDGVKERAFIIQCYGSVLAPLSGGTRAFLDTSNGQDRDQGNLSRALGSVVGMAALRAEGGVGPQLTSHTFGLLKARNTPNQSSEDEWLSSDEGAEWVLRTVDEILEGVAEEVAMNVKL
ncbi:hypothetical protein D9611_002330 [Ephemerocybe angulata]|uniref:Uncharacterized protein n=1 Tax=Ephemerocybe angulata TaxID=980116 RepID=A0A8H5C1A0_9AGAR|nr:hypothetical protein D9611_002330 [Tulosesus angulatus]